MEEKSNKTKNLLLQQLYPLVQRAGQRSVSLLSSVRVFAPKPLSGPLMRTQRILERFFPREPRP